MKNKIVSVIVNVSVKISLLPGWAWDKLWAPVWKRAMKSCGRGVYLRPMSSDIKGLQNLSVGDGTSIPKGSTIYCTEAPLTIGRKVVFGPKPTIITGDHRIDIIGKHIIDVTVDEKLPENDQPVVIEDGVWIGANVTILKGVTIGRGSVVAAGAVVTKSCAPYSIIGGVPAKLIKMRFTEEEIKKHEESLSPAPSPVGRGVESLPYGGRLEGAKRVLVVGSAEQSGGGVASVIKLMKKMPVWKEHQCYWLGTQIQRNYAWKLWYAVKAYLKALFIIWRYDIIHFHTVPDRMSLIIQMPIFLLAHLGRKKTIMHIHMGNQLKNHTENRLFKWCLRHTDLIVLLAQKWQAMFQNLFADIKTPTTVIYNACEEVPEVPFEAKEKIIMMAAYFCDNKAPDLLLKAWQKIKDKYPDWRVYMLGNGEVERFKKMAEEMGLQDSVTFTGYVTGKEREDYFRKASIYAMCSYEEGFPMVVLEAWAYGICVVTTPVGGLPDVLEDGKNVLTFDFGDWEGLADKLLRLMEDGEERKAMAAYSRQMVYERFSLTTINQQYKACLKEI
jgi:glycosyltransferase involved in cell wall biosynthesis/acetyltransferase-like isoleucine patch superfamily enzyme